MNNKKRNFKTLRYGSATALMVVIFVAILVFVNIFAGYITDRFSLKEDMTEEQLFTVSDEAKEVLAEVDEDVTVYILTKETEAEQDDTIRNAAELIKLYNTETGGHIDLEYLDRHTNQRFYEEHPEAREVEEVAFVVKSDKRYIVLDSYDFYDYAIVNGMKLENKKRYQTEELIVSAILHVTSEEVSGSGFVTSHNETDVSMLKGIFSDNRFEINKAVDLAKPVPEDIKNLVISAPQVDFSETEIKNLETYLSKGGNNLYVFIDGFTPSLPVLERYLAEWGLQFTYEAVYDEEASYYNIEAERQGEGYVMDGSHILATVKDKEIINNTAQGKLQIIAPYMRPIKLLFGEQSYNRTLELLTTANSAMGVVTVSEGDGYSRKINSYGPFTVAAIGERANGKNGMDGVSRIIAFGSATFANAEYFEGVPVAYNENVLSEVVKYANPDTSLLAIEPKVVEADDLLVTKDDIDMLFWILVVIMPIVILASGIVIFILRRRK